MLLGVFTDAKVQIVRKIGKRVTKLCRLCNRIVIAGEVSGARVVGWCAKEKLSTENLELMLYFV